eukprot:COSAG01_NODE_1503_length_10093_cov_8.276010_6_plen_46_part_00
MCCIWWVKRQQLAKSRLLGTHVHTYVTQRTDLQLYEYAPVFSKFY